MRFACLVVSSTLLLPLLAHAAPGAPIVRKIERVPATLRQGLPQQAKSIFFGDAKIASNHSDVFLHYYSVPNRKKSDELPYEIIEYLDLLQRPSSLKQDKRLETFHRLNTIYLMGPETSWFRNNDNSAQFTLFSIRWLQPKKQRGPMLTFSNDTIDGYLFVTFPRGLKGKPNVQAFGSSSNGSSWVETSFNEVDERGFLVIHESGGEVNSGELTTYSIRYYWNGTKFAKRKGERSNS